MIDVFLTDRQRQLRTEVRAWLDDVYPPERVAALERDREYPEEFWAACGERGWCGIPVPVDYGGRGGTVTDLCVFVEEVARTTISLATLYITATIFGSHALEICGSAAQRERLLPNVASGAVRFGLAMSEPGAGSDFAAMTTTATRVAGGWRIDGRKGPSSGAERCEVLITAARTATDPASRNRGISLFLVEPPAPGLTFERRDFGAMRGLPVDDVVYDSTVIGDDAMLGVEGEGWGNLARLMGPERLANAAQAIGVAQAAIDDAITYARERQQYGKPIGEFQAVAHPLATAYAEIAAARLLVYAAARKCDVGDASPLEVSMAKMTANNVAMRATEAALLTAGARGYEEASPFLRRFLEARGCELGGGTSQIQRNVISRQLGLR